MLENVNEKKMLKTIMLENVNEKKMLKTIMLENVNEKKMLKTICVLCKFLLLKVLQRKNCKNNTR